MPTNKEIVAQYANWAQQHVDDGFDMTLLTFMFNQLDPALGSFQAQQCAELERIYGALLTRMIRRPNRPSRLDPLPRWICCPDWPVPKGDKDHFCDIRINGGLHHHAIALNLGTGRLKTSLTDFVDEEQRLFSGSDRLLWRLHAEPVTRRHAYVVRYVLKWVEQGGASSGEVFLLPRSLSELGPTAYGDCEVPR